MRGSRYCCASAWPAVNACTRRSTSRLPRSIVIYAIWLIGMGCTFFSLAANAGILYLTGSLCFLLALVAPLVSFYMPLVVGALMSVNLMTLGLVFRRVAREAAAH